MASARMILGLASLNYMQQKWGSMHSEKLLYQKSQAWTDHFLLLLLSYFCLWVPLTWMPGLGHEWRFGRQWKNYVGISRGLKGRGSCPQTSRKHFTYQRLFYRLFSASLFGLLKQKYYRLGALDNIYFSQFFRQWSPRSRHLSICSLKTSIAWFKGKEFNSKSSSKPNELKF